MYKLTKKPIRRRRRLAAAIGRPRDRELMRSLTREMWHVFIDTGAELGLSRKDQSDAFERAFSGNKRPRPSQALINRTLALGDLLSTWRRDKRYTGSDGSPRVLPIHGKGATLESLARKFVPTMPLREVVEIICSRGEVTRYKGERVALVGSSVVIHAKTPEVTLATLVTGFRHFAETVIYNAAIPAEIRGTGRFERQVTGIISEKTFRNYSRAIRPQLQDLCDRVDEGLNRKNESSVRKSGRTCGVWLFVFRDDGKIG